MELSDTDRKMTEYTGSQCADCSGNTLSWAPIQCLPDEIPRWEGKQRTSAEAVLRFFGADSDGFAFLCLECGNVGGVEIGTTLAGRSPLGL
jgi:hypothetical protein